MTLPRRIKKQSVRQSDRIRCPAHLKWVRDHACCAETLLCEGPIQAAHVRTGTDGGTALKPGDDWTISLCAWHHARQHQIGEAAFESRYDVDMKKLAAEFAAKSPALARRNARVRRAS